MRQNIRRKSWPNELLNFVSQFSQCLPLGDASLLRTCGRFHNFIPQREPRHNAPPERSERKTLPTRRPAATEVAGVAPGLPLCADAPPERSETSSQPDGRQRPKSQASCNQTFLDYAGEHPRTTSLCSIPWAESVPAQTHRPRGWRGNSPNQTAGSDRSRRRCARNYRRALTHRPKGRRETLSTRRPAATEVAGVAHACLL